MGTTAREQDAGKLLLTVGEAASRLALSRSHLYRLIQTGDLRSITIGRSRRIPASVLHEFVEDRLRGEANDC
jgi:excisionase family DNA binding protein